MKNHRAKTKGPKFGLLNSFLTTVKFWMISPGLRISDCYIAFMQPCNDWMISASQILGSEFRTLGWFLYNTAAKTQGQSFGLLHGFRFIQHYRFGRNMSKTSASVSSEVPNTEKQMKARGRRPSAFIERFHMTSQISREIWVAMLVFHIFQDGGKSPERLCEQPWSLSEETLLWKDFFCCYRSHFNSRQSVWSRLVATGRILGFPAIISNAWDKLPRQGSKLFGACKRIISPFQRVVKAES